METYKCKKKNKQPDMSYPLIQRELGYLPVAVHRKGLDIQASFYTNTNINAHLRHNTSCRSTLTPCNSATSDILFVNSLSKEVSGF